jgi:hypothetical protein
MQARWWQNILLLLAGQSLESFGNPYIPIEASVTVESLERDRIRCVTAYRIRRGEFNGAGDDSEGYLLHCTVVFGIERKPVPAYFSRQQRVSGLPLTDPRGHLPMAQRQLVDSNTTLRTSKPTLLRSTNFSISTRAERPFKQYISPPVPRKHTNYPG